MINDYTVASTSKLSLINALMDNRKSLTRCINGFLKNMERHHCFIEVKSPGAESTFSVKTPFLIDAMNREVKYIDDMLSDLGYNAKEFE